MDVAGQITNQLPYLREHNRKMSGWNVHRARNGIRRNGSVVRLQPPHPPGLIAHRSPLPRAHVHVASAIDDGDVAPQSGFRPIGDAENGVHDDGLIVPLKHHQTRRAMRSDVRERLWNVPRAQTPGDGRCDVGHVMLLKGWNVVFDAELDEDTAQDDAPRIQLFSYAICDPPMKRW